METEFEGGAAGAQSEDSLEDVQDVTEAGMETSADAVPSPVEAVTDISGSLAAVFVLSMILGLLLFDVLSKRWHT